MKNGIIYLAALFFAFMSLLHLARLFCFFPVTIGTFGVPAWFSYIGFVLFGLVSAFLFRARHVSNID
jgi:hypothetical protein